MTVTLKCFVCLFRLSDNFPHFYVKKTTTTKKSIPALHIFFQVVSGTGIILICLTHVDLKNVVDERVPVLQPEALERGLVRELAARDLQREVVDAFF